MRISQFIPPIIKEPLSKLLFRRKLFKNFTAAQKACGKNSYDEAYVMEAISQKTQQYRQMLAQGHPETLQSHEVFY